MAIIRSLLLTFVLIFILAFACPAASILLNETFTGKTAPNWVTLGNAQLTAAKGIDPNGSGWLRLTSSQNNQAGFAYDNLAVPFGYGIDAIFDFDTWGGSGADGFAFTIFDGTVTPGAAGAYGGSLGYAQHGSTPGLAGGILGIGFDEYGNYANPTEGRQGGTGFSPDTISIRGPGDGTANAFSSTGAANYAYLFSSQPLPQYLASQGSWWGAGRPNDDSNQRQAEVLVDTSQIPSGHLPVTVMLTGGDGKKVVVAQYDAYKDVLAYYGNDPSAIPSVIKFGFTGSTGSLTDYHEIQGLQVTSVQNAPGYATVAPEPSPVYYMAGGIALIWVGSLRRRRERGA